MSPLSMAFVPISSSINPSFWNKLSEVKLNVDKLKEVKRPIWGYFSNIHNKCEDSILEVNSTSFNTDFESQMIYIQFHGKILNVNTIEQFKDCDKTKIINDIGREIIESIENGEALGKPSLLNTFFVFSFADLKKYQFYYWFAFPVPRNLPLTCNQVKEISDYFTVDEMESLWKNHCDLNNYQKPYFIVYCSEGSVEVFTLKQKIFDLNEENYPNYYFGFYDQSLSENCPGSMLRNYIILILHYCPFLQGNSANFLSLRLKRGKDFKLTLSTSRIFNLELPTCTPSVSDFINEDPEKGWVGWERNEKGRMGPRLSNMKSFLDPKELAESSVDLNLKLMKWRLLSNIDLDKIKRTKFLLLGSGTLGCSVARILLGWGARDISFVDNSIVSFSNPVRQSLFTFEDSKNATPKSVAAADNLRTIFPGVNSRSFQLTIPMPGHSIGEGQLEQVKQDVKLLTGLIEEHDVIFLLMDSRESRWLPTVLATFFDKTVINAALGFDSYLVMRHGVRVDLNELQVRQHPPGFKSLKGNFLGCYFCNDVTAPGNSMKDRTLDQQCTVTRPGVSAIAGALAAELAISLLQHKEGAKAPAFFQIGNVVNIDREVDFQCVLGLIPHSIRGYLSTFSQAMPATERYNQCVACSDAVQEAFGKDGFNFLLEVFQNSKFLEDITGLSDLTKEALEIGIWEFSDEEEIQCINYEDESRSTSGTSGDHKSKSDILLDSDFKGSEEGRDLKSAEEFLIDAAGTPGELASTQEETTDFSFEECELSEIAENILEKLLSKVESITSNNSIKEAPYVSTTEFINSDLPNDILTIVEKKSIISSEESMMEIESINTQIASVIQKSEISLEDLDMYEQTESSVSFDDLNDDFSSTTSHLGLLPYRTDSTASEQNLLLTQTISNVTNISETSIPNELIPILEKQSAVSGSSLNVCRQSSINFKNSILSLKSKIKTSVPSEHRQISQFSNSSRQIVNVNSDSPPVSSKNEIALYRNEISAKKIPSNKETVVSTFFQGAKESVSNFFKSKIGSFTKSNSVRSDNPKPDDIVAKEKSSDSLEQASNKTDKMMTVFEKQGLETSDSLSSEDLCKCKEVNIPTKIITLVNPKQMLSSGSSTTDSLDMDDSVFYLAKTDSDKIMD